VWFHHTLNVVNTCNWSNYFLYGMAICWLDKIFGPVNLIVYLGRSELELFDVYPVYVSCLPLWQIMIYFKKVVFGLSKFKPVIRPLLNWTDVIKGNKLYNQLKKLLSWPSPRMYFMCFKISVCYSECMTQEGQFCAHSLFQKYKIFVIPLLHESGMLKGTRKENRHMGSRLIVKKMLVNLGKTKMMSYMQSYLEK